MIIMTMLTGNEDKGNVIPELVIAALGAATNTFFWRRYTFLHQQQGNSILIAGILCTAILSTMLFKETITLLQAGCIIMIAAGIMGLKLLA